MPAPAFREHHWRAWLCSRPPQASSGFPCCPRPRPARLLRPGGSPALGAGSRPPAALPAPALPALPPRPARAPGEEGGPGALAVTWLRGARGKGRLPETERNLSGPDGGARLFPEADVSGEPWGWGGGRGLGGAWGGQVLSLGTRRERCPGGRMRASEPSAQGDASPAPRLGLRARPLKLEAKHWVFSQSH
ncbi:hypothetical protein VULLAG_LOCUS20162 [Vulpes lagopus]